MVGGGAFVVGTMGVESDAEREVGDIATVWDVEIAGAAVRRAGRMGKARSRHLRDVVNTIGEIREGGGVGIKHLITRVTALCCAEAYSDIIG